MTTAAREIDHAAYARRVRRLSEAELLYIITDCRESLAAWPDCPNAGRYQDEISYAAAELERRRRGGRRARPTAADVAASELAAVLED